MKRTFYLIPLVIFSLASCQKEPGTGGTSTISGKVWVLDYNSEYTQINNRYYAMKEDVYLIYGNDVVYSESYKTSYDGSYRFDHLRKGKYRLFCYSDDTTGTIPGGKFPVIKDVEITSNGQDLKLDDFVIAK